MKFAEYAARNDIELLPDDIKYIRRHIKRIPEQHRNAVLKRYVETWVNTRDNCENATQAQNEGRRAANIWIRSCKHDG